ncbi:MAG: META domain-containing protein [Acidimicrobiia bacterium]
MRNRTKRARFTSIVTLFAVLGLLALAACDEGLKNDPTGRTWQLTELEGSSLVDGTVIDLTIDGDTASGSAGCNTYNGPATVDQDTSAMTLGPNFAVTFMACDQPIMDQEQKYLDALTRVVSYQLAAEELILEDANGIAVATFG